MIDSNGLTPTCVIVDANKMKNCSVVELTNNTNNTEPLCALCDDTNTNVLTNCAVPNC